MDAHDQEIQQKENRTTADRNREDQNAPFKAVQKQPITEEYRAV